MKLDEWMGHGNEPNSWHKRFTWHERRIGEIAIYYEDSKFERVLICRSIVENELIYMPLINFIRLSAWLHILFQKYQ